MATVVIAIQFLTCLPVPLRPKLEGPALGRSMRWFPAVGAGIGLLLAAADALLAPLATPELRAMTLVALLILLTGALHLDGLMDTCDALFAPVAAERRLDILRDSRVGSFAVVGAATALLLKYSAILAVPDSIRPATFVAVFGISRWALVFATVRYPAARTEGLGATYKAGAGRRELLIASLLAVLAATPLGLAGMVAFALAWTSAALLARMMLAKIPGLTGDTYGAICESVEILVMMCVPVLYRLLPGLAGVAAGAFGG